MTLAKITTPLAPTENPDRRAEIVAAVLALPALGHPNLDDRYGVHRLTAIWLDGRPDNTANAYHRDLAQWLDWCTAQRLDPFTARGADVTQYRTDLETGHAASTVARKLSAVSSWYAFLVANEAAPRNPVAAGHRPKVDRDESVTVGLSREEAARFLRAAGRDRYEPKRTAALLALMLTEGVRVSEIVNGDITDLGHDRGYRTITVTRKGGKRQALPLAPPVAAAIDLYLDGRTDGPLFVTESGRRMDRWAITKLIRRIAREAEIPSWEALTPHSLRHSFITLSLDAGAALRDVQDAAGHRDPRTTRRYDRARFSLDRHPASQLVAFLDLGTDG